MVRRGPAALPLPRRARVCMSDGRAFQTSKSSRVTPIPTGPGHLPYMELPLGQVDVFEFSNENIFVRFNENLRARDIFIVQTMTSPVNTRLMELFIMIDAARRASPAG